MPYPQPFGRGAPSGGSLLDRHGNLKLVLFTGGVAPVTIQVPGNVVWRMISISFLLTTGGANSFSNMHYLDASGNEYATYGTVQQVVDPGSARIGYSTFGDAAGVGNQACLGAAIGESSFLMPGASIVLDWGFAVPPPTISDGAFLVEEWIV